MEKNLAIVVTSGISKKNDRAYVLYRYGVMADDFIEIGNTFDKHAAYRSLIEIFRLSPSEVASIEIITS